MCCSPHIYVAMKKKVRCHRLKIRCRRNTHIFVRFSISFVRVRALYGTFVCFSLFYFWWCCRCCCFFFFFNVFSFSAFLYISSCAVVTVVVCRCRRRCSRRRCRCRLLVLSLFMCTHTEQCVAMYCMETSMIEDRTFSLVEIRQCLKSVEFLFRLVSDSRSSSFQFSHCSLTHSCLLIIIIIFLFLFCRLLFRVNFRHISFLFQ